MSDERKKLIDNEDDWPEAPLTAAQIRRAGCVLTGLAALALALAMLAAIARGALGADAGELVLRAADAPVEPAAPWLCLVLAPVPIALAVACAAGVGVATYVLGHSRGEIAAIRSILDARHHP